MKLDSEIYKQLSLTNFVVFDLETTGLSPDEDEIIEIGMIKIKEGKVTETYNQLFDPGIPIPENITRLTGINPTDCSGQPFLKDRISDIMDFMDSDFVVAHNADFDVSFLNAALIKYAFPQKKIYPEKIIDTLDLSRFLLYHLNNHTLRTLSDHFALEGIPSHRALDDAKACGLIFIRLVELCLELDKETVRICCNLLHETNFGIKYFFHKLNSYLQKYGSVDNTIQRQGKDNIIGKLREKSEQELLKKISSQDLKKFFDPQGYLSQQLRNFEYRKQQYEMADSVRKAFNQNSFLLAEAGTGIGKSLAYLIPALLWTIENPQSKVVISTNTKNLQDQLFFHDLPFLQRIPSLPFLAILLKGRANYICQRAWEDTVENPKIFTDQERKQLLPLIIWIQETITGDIEEHSGFSRNWNKSLWRRLSCERGDCNGGKCRFETTCFLKRVRKLALYADIIVVNHSLLFSDISAGNTILKSYDSVIIDEAHNMEASATNSFKLELNVWKFYDLLRIMYQDIPTKTGLLYFIQKKVKQVIQNKKDQATLKGITADLIGKVRTLGERSLHFFHQLQKQHQPKTPASRQYWQKRFTGKEQLFCHLDHDAEQLGNDLEQLNKDFIHLGRVLGDMACNQETEYYKWLRDLEFIQSQLDELEKLLHHFIQADYRENIIWSMLPKSKRQRDISLYSVPLDISDILENSLFSHLERGVLTSATLRVNDSFDYYRKRIGLEDFDPERVHAEFFGSPFNYSEQTLFIIPSYLSDPRENNFIKDVSDLLKSTLSTTSYGTMVLFTSYKMLQDVYYSLLPLFKEKEILLLGQGIDGSRSTILKIFKENKNSILLGTNSFWEGVDIPGAALEMLIITKIPFQVPTDPVFEARMEKINKETGNGFLNYAVPEAVIRLRQGIGRLIRSTGDRGVVLLLDQRLIKSQYGDFFTHSLPVQPTICKQEDLLQNKLKAWF